MNTFMKTFVLIVVLLGVTVLPGQAAASVGDPAPVFDARDTDGKTHSMSSYKGKYVVLEWFNSGCPFVKKHYDSGKWPFTSRLC